MARTILTARNVRFVTDYAKADDPAPDDDNTLVIPEDLTALSAEQIAELSVQAEEAFLALYDGGAGAVPENMDALRALTEGREALAARQAELDEQAAALAAEAQELAARAGVTLSSETEGEEGAEAPAEGDEAGEGEDGDGDGAGDDGAEAPAEDAAPVEGEPEPVTASARKELRLNLGGLNKNRSQQTTHSTREFSGASKMSDLVTASEDLPMIGGKPVDSWSAIAAGVDKRLQGFNVSQYENAARQNRHVRTQYGVAVINKQFDPELVIRSNDREHIEEVMARAMDESRLPGGSLVASGGWCAPSTTDYSLIELESRDGLWSGPEVGIMRGGIRHPENGGPDFADIYNDTGFRFTEEQDISGDDYPKPCFKVGCPDFVDDRLLLDGVCITAGLLQSRGYPEAIARVIRGALVAHDHKVSGGKIAAMVAGSTEVNITAGQAGTTAPILTSIEVQVEHYRNVRRMARSTTLEAVFPFWVHGAIRADLSRRQGVDLLDVSDERINAWFRQRGIAPQFVYNWQDISNTAASATVAFPTDVSFLLYAAGTWVAGGADVITLDHVYDSILLGTNDYTALFSEEGWLMSKMGPDSRVVNVPICTDGATKLAVDIDCDGSAA